uniref:Troponin I n=1 Tax=Schistocephalus solidus TaxID=70667 RepID=A0A0X3PHC3_SCHSO
MQDGQTMNETNSEMETFQANAVDAESSNSEDLSNEDEDEEEKEEMLERMTQSGIGRSGRRLSSLDVYLLKSKPEIENYLLKSKESLRKKLEEVKLYENQHQLTDEERRASVIGSKRLEILLARMERNEEKQRESAARERSERRRSTILLTPHRKGLGVLTREKKARLKQLLLKKAKDDLHREQREMLKAKEAYLHRVCPPVDFGSMNDAELKELVKELHFRAVSLESDLLDWEERIRAQEEEIHRLVQGTQEQRGRL